MAKKLLSNKKKTLTNKMGTILNIKTIYYALGIA